MENGPSDVRHWLGSLNLQEFAALFVNCGYNTLKKCSTLNESHLRQLHIPQEHHHVLLHAASNLRQTFLDSAPSLVDEIPPPLPEKKSRRSLPSPNVKVRNAKNIPKSPLASRPTSELTCAPPVAPTRRSVLRKCLPVDVTPPRNTDRSAELHIIDLLPPPPPAGGPVPLHPDLIDLMSPPAPPTESPPPELPIKNRNSMILPTPVEQITKELDDNTFFEDHYVTQVQPPLEKTKKVRPTIKPRPPIAPKPQNLAPVSPPLPDPKKSPPLPDPKKSPVPLRATASSTLPQGTQLSVEEHSGPKSATLPVFRVSFKHLYT